MPRLLNPKHERFAQERARGKSLTDAWQRAGGSGRRNYACALTQRPEIAERIRELLTLRIKQEPAAIERAARALAIDKLWVLSGLVDNINRAMQAEAVKVRGKPTGQYRYDGNVANRSFELIGKELGMFVERSENTTVRHLISDEPLTPEQWEERYVRKDK
ncbi:phage terminase small subunit [Rhizobiales bacterium GAS188]|nr:phage terminase small subunit [Rhizobiales bacterium GAS188]